MHGELERLVHVGAARVDDDLARRVLDEERVLQDVLRDDPGLVDLARLALGVGLGGRVVLGQQRAVPDDFATALRRGQGTLRARRCDADDLAGLAEAAGADGLRCGGAQLAELTAGERLRKRHVPQRPLLRVRIEVRHCRHGKRDDPANHHWSTI